MHTLTITHTSEEGTLIDGTSRGDGTAEILKAQRWRWGRSISAWYIPRSRDQYPKTHIIDATVDALQQAGFTVTVELDTTPRSTADVEQDRLERAEARAQHFAGKSEQLHAQAEQLHARAQGASSHIPFGQPILVGHHSEGRDRRTRDQISRTYDKAFATFDEANAAAEAAERATQATAPDSAPAISRRLNRLSEALRAWETNYAGERATPRSTAEIARLQDRIQYWTQQRQQLIDTGQAVDYSRENIAPDDLVSTGHRSWYYVVRANKTTVAVKNGLGTHRIRYDQITDHKRKAETSS